MLHRNIKLNVKGSLENASFTTYFIDRLDEVGINKRPCIVLCPGGGYEFLSDREGEFFALQYLARGINAVVLKYSCKPAVYPTALLELAETVRQLRENAEEWNIDPEKIIVSGASAGGHLAASYSVFWSEDFIAKEIGVSKEILRPNAQVLCYPVITSGEYAHRGSFVALLGDRYDELVDKMSLENQVNKDTPKAFVWHTFEDGYVPPENSLLYVNALRKAGIPTEFHMFQPGGHGIALASEMTAWINGDGVVPQCQCWIDLACAWIKNL